MKLNVNRFCTVAAFLILGSAVLAEVRLVPSVYQTIQAGIDAAANGDTVVVAQGTYYEDVNSRGKSITLRSIDPNDANVVAATVIDGNDSGTVVTFPDNASAVCLLAGFTITGGNSSSDGGGILCLNGAIDINNCIITGNSAAGNGGGIASEYADLTLSGCMFSANMAYGSHFDSAGGGIFTNWGKLTLTGCKFSENEAVNESGGGIRSISGELTLTNCTFNSNSAAQEGGGVATDYNSVIVTNCTFTGNSARWGGGMSNSHWGATATNCVFNSNSADRGGGIRTYNLFKYDETLRLSNCTFSQNVADDYGGAVDNQYDGNIILNNCILWGNIANEGPQIAIENEGTVSVNYSCLQGDEEDVYTGGEATLDWGYGNIDDDPCFADSSGGDFHLLSTAGRWDANAGIWVADDSNSPCIDAGDPNSDWTAELWPHGKCINMGVFGGTAEASMSESEVGNIADLDPNGSVNWSDLRILTGKWLVEELLLSEDLNRDGLVNGLDFAIFADEWAWSE